MAVRFWELSNYRKCWHRRWWCAYAQHQLQYTVTTMNGFKILLLPHKFCWDKVVILLPDSTFLEPKDLITDLGTMNQIPSLRRRSFPTESRILTAQELLMEYSLVVILLECFIMVSSSSKMVRQLEETGGGFLWLKQCFSLLQFWSIVWLELVNNLTHLRSASRSRTIQWGNIFICCKEDIFKEFHCVSVRSCKCEWKAKEI